MKEDLRIESVDVSEGFTQVEITEPNLPAISIKSMKLEAAAKIARSFDEPEPDSLGYNSWLNCEFPVLTSDMINMHWSCACQDEIATEMRRIDNIGKPKVKGYTRPRSKWVGDGLRAPHCGVCGGLHIEYHDCPGSHCECIDDGLPETIDGVALTTYTTADDSSSDDDLLPMYACITCDDAMVHGGGGTLECSKCRSQRIFEIGEHVALLGLQAKGYNHRQGVVVCKRNDRYGVRLVGTSDPIAIRPVNMRTIVGIPVYRERPRELEAAMCEIKAHGPGAKRARHGAHDAHKLRLARACGSSCGVSRPSMRRHRACGGGLL
jgi:hypothetical protein